MSDFRPTTTGDDAATEPLDASGMAGGAPPATFDFLVQTLFTQALMALGRIPNPITGQAVKNVPTARHFHDMLGMLEEKTKGNLDRDERRLIDEAQHQLRVLLLEATGGDPRKEAAS